MTTADQRPADPPGYPRNGTYADLLTWHLEVWWTRHEGSTFKRGANPWKAEIFLKKIFGPAGNFENQKANLSNWTGRKKKERPGRENAKKISEVIFGHEPRFLYWIHDLEAAWGRCIGAGNNVLKISVEDAIAELVKGGYCEAIDDVSATEAIPFAHRQYHKSKADPTSLIQLLQTDMRATSLVGRDAELTMLRDWLAAPQSIAVKYIIGGAGAGKTRLAIEICEKAETDGWFATFLPSSELQSPHDMQALADWALPQPSLLVVDYAATSVSAIKQWFGALALQRNREGHKLRILLLERHADRDYGWWPDLSRPDSHSHASAADLIGTEMPYMLPPLDALRDRRALLAEVMVKAAPLCNPPRSKIQPPELGADALFDQRLSQNSVDTQPLYLMMAGIRAVEVGAPSALSMSRLKLAQWVVATEESRLRDLAIQRGFNDKGKQLKHIVACITLQNGCEPAELPSIVREERQAMGMIAPFDDEMIANILCDFLPVAPKVEPIRPDLIGESFCLTVIRGGKFRSDAVQNEIVLRCWQRDPIGTGSTLIRCAGDFAEHGEPSSASIRYLRVIMDACNDYQKLKAISEEIPLETLALAQFAHELSLKILHCLKSMHIEHPENFAPDLAKALNAVSMCSARIGRHDEALEMAEQALALYRQLAAGQSAAPTANLAMALNAVAGCLVELRRHEEALDIAKQALNLFRQLASEYPGAFMLELAMAHHNLACCLGQLSRHEEALNELMHTLTIYSQLTDLLPPGTLLPNYAIVFNTAAPLLDAQGLHDEALDVTQEALTRYQQLAAEHPDAFTGHLGMALTNFAVSLGKSGRNEEALAADEKALDIYRQLSSAFPDAFTPNLVTALNNVAYRFRKLGRRDEALDAAEQALLLYLQLVTARPNIYAKTLSDPILMISDMLDRGEFFRWFFKFKSDHPECPLPTGAMFGFTSMPLLDRTT